MLPQLYIGKGPSVGARSVAKLPGFRPWTPIWRGQRLIFGDEQMYFGETLSS